MSLDSARKGTVSAEGIAKTAMIAEAPLDPTPQTIAAGPVCSVSLLIACYLTSSSSISNTSPAFPGIPGGACCAIPKIGRNNQFPFSANPHSFETLIPSANDLTGAKPERKRLAAD